MRSFFYENRTLPAPISEVHPFHIPQDTENYVKFDFMPYGELFGVNDSSSEEQPDSDYSSEAMTEVTSVKHVLDE